MLTSSFILLVSAVASDPYVGIVEFDQMNLPGSRLSIADLPGLIDGAHENRGLGHSFLRHIERTKVSIVEILQPIF
jgi:GTP-binding protein